jgi:hypothetical protein
VLDELSATLLATRRQTAVSGHAVTVRST